MVGGDILRLITAGMYDSPLILFREYLQNSADAVASSGHGGAVLVGIEPLESRLTITDDGPGLSRTEAVSRLIPIGNSVKDPAVDRGLRGIGRLASLAFSDGVHFTTRADGSGPVTRVSWSGSALRSPRLDGVDAETAIKECTSVHTVTDGHWPERFFQVTVEGVTRHAASTLLNRDAVKEYIAQVCPVPISSSFPLCDEVNDFLSQHIDHFALDVRFDAAESPVTRPFGDALPLTESYAAPFERLETRVIPSLDTGDAAAVLWLAHTPYAGSIPLHLGVRGLRARSGNIQVGSEDVFSKLFHETRFNGWCVGEVHIADSRIVPNGRRDYFEPGPHLRNLENHLGAIAQEISARCRRASSHRNRLRQAAAAVRQAEAARVLAQSGCLLPEDATTIVESAQEKLSGTKDMLVELKVTRQPACGEDVADPSGEGPVQSDSDVFEGLDPQSVRALQSAFGALATELPPDTALDLILAMLRRLSDHTPSR